MPRDRANIRTNIWADTHWRSLSKGAQHLYLLLLSHPELSYAGVCDWRPGRIARMTDGETIESVTRDADELERAAFVLRDDETEEICVRSFVKHDGLMKQPLLAVSMANAYAGIASPPIRRVVAWEVQKLHAREPKLAAWEKPAVKTVLDEPAFDLTAAQAGAGGSAPAPELGVDLTPALSLGLTPGSDQSQALPTTTATTTATEEHLVSSADADDRSFLPESWAPSQRHRDRAASLGLDIDRSAYRFTEHARRTNRRQKNWHSAFSNWLTKDIEYRQQDRVHGSTSSTPAAPRRMTAAEQNMARFQQKYGETAHEPQGDRAALGPGVSDRLADGD